MHRSEQILETWFGPQGAPTPPDRFSLWFGATPAIDRSLRERFGDDVQNAIAGRHDDWAVTARGRMALFVLLDQLPRNIYRGTAGAFSGDAKALKLAQEGTAMGMDLAFPHLQRAFFYLPFEHAEDLATQVRSVQLFRNLRDSAPLEMGDFAKTTLVYAVRHWEIIERFGRFPHRNKMVGRETTEAEARFLTTPFSGF